MRRSIAGFILPLGCCLTLLFAAPPASAAPWRSGPQDPVARGKITGTVIDEYNAMTLPRAPVQVVGTETIVYSDLDGRFTLELAPGTYTIRVNFAGYRERVVPGVVVQSGQVTQLDLILLLEGIVHQERVVVRASEPELASEEAALLERKRAGAISDNMAAEQMKKNADSDAADAMRRVTGLSVVNNQYVYVRGLGERYSNATLNGMALPTTEPDKRVVPFDLFPSGLVDSIRVVKSYTPDQPGSFSGGLIQIEPLSFPAEETLSVSISQGGDSRTAFSDVISYPGGDRDWFGFDDGTRELPSVIPPERVIRGGIFTDIGFVPDELEQFGEAFANVWSPRVESAPQNQSYSVYYGNSGDRWGTVVSWAYKNDHHFQTENQQFFRVGADEAISVRNDYDFSVSSNSVKQGLVANVSFRPTTSHKLLFENFWTHKADDETREFIGFNDDIATDIRNSRLRWVEEDILSNKISGEHFFPVLSNSRLEWHVARSRADRDEPDLREVLYERNATSGEFVLADESRSGLRQFIDQQDEMYEAGLDLSLFFDQWDGLPSMIEFGPSVSFRERDFSSRQFRFARRFLRNLDLTLPPEQLFTPENIGVAFELREETRPTDAYRAEHDVYAGYVMTDLPLAERLRLVGGVRVEKSEQSVDTFNPFAVFADVEPITTRLDDTDVLPGVNLIYRLRDDHNLRFGFSQTVNRPEFRELAPFEFTDVVGGRAVIGNPALQRALVRSFDVRWEMFPTRTEVIAASFFYKDFEDPIERVVEPTAQLRTSYTNADSARNFGVELEAQVEASDVVGFGANYTWVDSEVQLTEQAGQVQTSLERPLAGQSENIFNGFVDLRVPQWEFSVRLLANYFGDRITDVGSLGLPDIIEQGRELLDLVFTKRLQPVSVRFAVGNLTDADYEFTQGDQTHRIFRIGRSFSGSLSVDVF